MKETFYDLNTPCDVVLIIVYIFRSLNWDTFHKEKHCNRYIEKNM